MAGAYTPARKTQGDSPRDSARLSAGSELRRKWLILAGATVAMFSGATSLPYATSGIFVTSLQAEFGWSRLAISLGPSMIMLGIALTSPMIGLLTEKVDPRRLIVPGMLVVSACFVALATVSGPIWQYYAACLAIAFLGNLSGAAALTAIVTRYFERARGAALGIAMGGAGLTTAIAGPSIMVLLSDHGWRAGYVALALFSLAMTPLVWLLLRSDVEAVATSASKEQDGDSFGEALANPIFWSLTAAFFLVSVGSTGLFVHFVPLLTDRGIDPRSAAALSSIIGLTIIVSRLGTGFIVDKVPASLVAAVIMLLGACGYAAFLFEGTGSAAMGAFAVGVSFGAETDLVGFMVARYFGLRAYGRVFGLMYGICLSGLVISPLMYGLIRDRWGSYDPMLVLAFGLLVASATIFAFIPRSGRNDT